MNTINVKDFKSLQDSQEPFQLIDVREAYEHEEYNIKGELIPLATIPANVAKIAKDKKVIIYCRSGSRSANAIRFLMTNFGYTNLYNLEGGVIAYKKEIDNSL